MMSGILAEDGAEGVGEGQTDFLFDRDLVDAGDLELDGIFDGDDVVDRVVEFVEGGVERGGFAGAGGAGHQDAARAARRPRALNCAKVSGSSAQLVDAGREVGLVQRRAARFSRRAPSA